jgi:hypothetical protein
METYVYFSAYDSSSEPIHKVKANNAYEAAQIFAEIKKLTVDEFISIFNVKAYGEETDETSI